MASNRRIEPPVYCENLLVWGMEKESETISQPRRGGIMVTYHLQHNTTRLLLPGYFETHERAKAHRAYIDGKSRFTIYKKVEKVESEDERETRLDREFENEVVERELETGYSNIQL